MRNGDELDVEAAGAATMRNEEESEEALSAVHRGAEDEGERDMLLTSAELPHEAEQEEDEEEQEFADNNDEEEEDDESWRFVGVSDGRSGGSGGAESDHYTGL